MKILVGVTGASGTVYALRLLEVLKGLGIEAVPVVSEGARKVMAAENPGELPEGALDETQLEAPFASGSHPFDAVVVVPCSMKTLAAIAAGYASNLITRSADVALKERRTLVLVPRETPLNAIHLENMLKLARLGAVILPAMPAFYPRPESVEEMVDFVVGKILDSLGIENSLYRRWGEDE